MTQTFDLGDYAVKAAYAQFKAKQVVPPSPDAANLGKYGNVPVSLFTGSPQVSIPLVELPTRYPLNISLTYGNSGFKPGEPASWVGLGWTLNAGGVVTRSALGNPDLQENYFGKQPIVLPPNNDLFQRYDIINDMRRGELETQPDVYYFNVGKLSGKFYIRQDGSIAKKTRDNIKITHCVTCGPTTSWFMIVDEQGFIYEFRDVENSYTVTDTQVPGDLVPVRSTYTYPSSWYLTKITSPDAAEVINLEYTNAGQHTTLNNNIQGQSVTFSRSTVINAGGSNCGPSGNVTSSTSFADLSMNKVTRKYLSRISVVRSGNIISYVDFQSLADTREDLVDADFPGERRLTKVMLYQRDGFGNTFKLRQEQELFHSYFIDPVNTVNASGKRLRLDSVRTNAVGPGTPNKPAHGFVYAPFQPHVTNPLGMDHWGFANGVPNTALVPNILIDNVPYGLGGNREPAALAAASGVLQRINYPTGGSTQFEWEGHQAFNGENALMPVGGLRIRTITDFSAANQRAAVKRYRYERTDLQSSGRTATVNYLSSSSFRKYPENCWGGPSVCCSHWTEYVTESWTVTANPVLALGSIQGSHVGYTRVVEESLDTTGVNPLGSSVYEYNATSFDPNDDDIGNGDLLKTSVFNNGGKLLSEVTNEYQVNNIGNVVYRTPQVELIQDSRIILCKFLFNGVETYEWRTVTSTNPQPCITSRAIKTRYNFGGYAVLNQEKFLVRQTQRLYDQGSNAFITSVKNFNYGTKHLMPIKIAQSTTGTEEVVNEIRYVLDYNTDGVSAYPGYGITLLQNANIVTDEIENVQYRQNADGSNRRFINATLNLYESGYQPTRLLRMENATAQSSYTMSAISGGNLLYDPKLKPYAALAYDNRGNLIQQQKDKDLPVSYVWDHDQALPTAEVKNATVNMIAYTSFESDGLGGFTTLPNLVTARVAGGFTGGYAYNLSGRTITRNSLPAGRTYVISYWSTTVAATVMTGKGNIAARAAVYPAHLGWKYFEHTVADPGSVTISGSVTIDELRIYPTDASMSSVAYVSMDALPKSMMDGSNNRSDFEYDGLNRLVNIRDDDNNIVKNFRYQYGNANTITPPVKTLFYSPAAQGNFSRQGCVVPSEPLPIVYQIPYGKYATTSQPTANNMANADIQQNGQAFANANGRCVVYNEQRTGTFLKTDCPPEQGTSSCPRGVTYTVPARKYFANTLAEANQMADNDLAANGPAFANATCGCNCDGMNKKSINGVCETGTLVYTGYEYVANCQTGWNYRCYFYYTFSDGSISPTYSSCSRFACVPQ